MLRTVRLDIRHAEAEQPRRRAHAEAMFWMGWVQELLLQMHKSACDLDEALVKEAIFIRALQPEMFQHIVRFVVLARIEAGEVTSIAWVDACLWRRKV